MSRIGKQPVQIPEGVDVKLDKSSIVVSGAKGTLKRDIPDSLKITISDGLVVVEPKRADKGTRAIHGTYRAHIANMVAGVSEGWVKELELVGTGYRTELSGNKLVLTIGYSHPVELDVPEGVNVKADKTAITLESADKESVGQFAAEVRAVRPPEPYKGKGIKYKEEVVRRKAGKAAKASEGAA